MIVICQTSRYLSVATKVSRIFALKCIGVWPSGSLAKICVNRAKYHKSRQHYEKKKIKLSFKNDILKKLAKEEKLREGDNGRPINPTLTGFPVVLEHETVRAQAKHPTHRGQTRVRAPGVVNAARTGVFVVLARVIVGGERRVLQALAGALVSSCEISTGVLARTVAVVQQTLVDICNGKRRACLIRR